MGRVWEGSRARRQQDVGANVVRQQGATAAAWSLGSTHCLNAGIHADRLCGTDLRA